MEERRFIVVETATYEGCFEHWGPYTSDEAQSRANALRARTTVFDYEVIELTPLTMEQAAGRYEE